MDELCGMLNGVSVEPINRLQEATDYGRMINYHINNFSSIHIDKHKQLIQNMFLLINMYSGTIVEIDDEDYQFISERKMLREQFICNYISVLLNNYNKNINTDNPDLIYLILDDCRVLFIHIYLYAHESDDNQSKNIHDYDRQLTFYEYDEMKII